MDNNNISSFSTQVIAIGRLFEWLRQSHQIKMDGTVKNKILTLDDSLSQRFAFGFPKKTLSAAKPQPFLGIQRTERIWMHPMQWHHAYVKRNDRKLYLVTSHAVSDDSQFPDIPSFCIAISVNDPDKLSLLFNQKTNQKILGREMWIDDSFVTHVNTNASLFSLPLTMLESNSPIPLDTNDPVDVISLQDEAQALQNGYQIPQQPNNRNAIGMGINFKPPTR
jgi:hypothetical protein